jgi:predicted aspartyl protease
VGGQSRATRAAAEAAGRTAEGVRYPGQKRQADGAFAALLDVEFRFPGDPRSYLALLDSGADYTMIPAEYLPSSIPYTTLRDPFMANGVGCQFEARVCDVEVVFDKWTFATVIAVVEPDKMPVPQALLGRLDFMSRFEVSFNWSAEPGSFTIRRIKRS